MSTMSSEERVAFLTEQQAALCQRYAALNEQLKALQQQFMAANPDQAEALSASPDVLKSIVMRAHPHVAQGIASFEQLVTLTQSALEAGGEPEQIRMVTVLQQFNATIRQSSESNEAMETQETGGRRVRTATKKAEEQEQVSANGRYKLSRNKTAVWERRLQVAEARGDPEEELASLRSNLEYWRERDKLQIESGKPPRAPSRRVRYADTDSDEDNDVSDEDDDFEANEDGENEEASAVRVSSSGRELRKVESQRSIEKRERRARQSAKDEANAWKAQERIADEQAAAARAEYARQLRLKRQQKAEAEEMDYDPEADADIETMPAKPDASSAVQSGDKPQQKFVDQILAWRVGPEETEYFCVFKGYSHRHAIWWPLSKIESEGPYSKARIFRFHKSNPPPWDGNVDGDAGLALSDEAPQQSAELFDPAYLEVDRILAARPKPGAGKRQRVKSEESDSDSEDETEMEYLVKWQNLGYASATWEDASEIRDDAHIQDFLNHNRLPSDLAPRARPAATSFVAMTESPVYKNDNQLRPWQIDGVNQLLYCWYNRRGVILADEMGLGKTVQTVATMVHIRRVFTRGPFLAIVPLSTLNHWKREFETWSELNTVVYQGTKADRDLIQHYEFRFWDQNGNEVRGAYKFEVLLCTFESLMADVTELSSIPFKAIIIDEAHRIKNRESKLFKILQMFSTEFRLLLTGTPIQNNIEELWTLLNFIDAQTFPSPTAFLNEYGTMTDESQVVKLQTLLRPYMLRRVKEDVAKHIPAKEETIIEVELTTVQKQYYRAVLERNTEFLYRGCKGSNTPKLLNVVMQLRKVCNHPFLIKGAQDKILASSNATLPAHYLQRLIESSGKLVLVDKLLPKLQSDGHKVLIFSQMKMVLDLIEEYCRLKQYVYERIDGDVRGNDRQAAIDRFNRPGSDRFVFLLCTRAGGLGINLQSADTVIIYDSDWNPQNDVQAQARCHRIGQTKEVKVYRLITGKTYEQKMFERASMKLGLDQAVLTNMRAGMESSKNAGQLGKKDIDALLKFGAYDIFKDDDEAAKAFVEQDIESILSTRSTVLVSKVDTHALEHGSTFSKATFASSEADSSLQIDDANFWQKLLPADSKSAPKMLERLKAGDAFLTSDLKQGFMEDLGRHVEACVEERTRGSLSADFDAIVVMLNIIASSDGSDGTPASVTAALTLREREQATEWLEYMENPRRVRRAAVQAAAATQMVAEPVRESTTAESAAALEFLQRHSSAMPPRSKYYNGLGGKLFLRGERANLEEAILQIAGGFRDEAISWERVRTRAGMGYRSMFEIIAFTVAFLDLCHFYILEVRGADGAASCAATCFDGEPNPHADASLFREAKRRLLQTLPDDLPVEYYMPVMTRKKKQSPSASMAISRVAALVRRRDRTANSAARLAGRAAADAAVARGVERSEQKHAARMAARGQQLQAEDVEAEEVDDDAEERLEQDALLAEEETEKEAEQPTAELAEAAPPPESLTQLEINLRDRYLRDTESAAAAAHSAERVAKAYHDAAHTDGALENYHLPYILSPSADNVSEADVQESLQVFLAQFKEARRADCGDFQVLIENGYQRHVKRLCKRWERLMLQNKRLAGEIQALGGEEAAIQSEQLLPTTSLPMFLSWWGPREDRDLMIGAYRHGMSSWTFVRHDPDLCFLEMVGKFTNLKRKSTILREVDILCGLQEDDGSAVVEGGADEALDDDEEGEGGDEEADEAEPDVEPEPEAAPAVARPKPKSKAERARLEAQLTEARGSLDRIESEIKQLDDYVSQTQKYYESQQQDPPSATVAALTKCKTERESRASQLPSLQERVSELEQELGDDQEDGAENVDRPGYGAAPNCFCGEPERVAKIAVCTKCQGVTHMACCMPNQRRQPAGWQCPNCNRRWPLSRSLDNRIRVLLDALAKTRREADKKKQKSLAQIEKEQAKKAKVEADTSAWTRRERLDFSRFLGTYGRPADWSLAIERYSIRKTPEQIKDCFEKTLTQSRWLVSQGRLRAKFRAQINAAYVQSQMELLAPPETVAAPAEVVPMEVEAPAPVESPVEISEYKAKLLQRKQDLQEELSRPHHSWLNEVASGPVRTICVCQRIAGDRFVVCCESCRSWLHGDCIGLSRTAFEATYAGLALGGIGTTSSARALTARAAQARQPFHCPDCRSQKAAKPFEGPSAQTQMPVGVRRKCASRAKQEWVPTAVAELERLLKKPNAESFVGAVDPEAFGIPDYFEFVHTPMDLGTVMQNLKAGAYSQPWQCAEDVRLVWRNCLTYNERDSQIAISAVTLQCDFIASWNRAFQTRCADEEQRVVPSQAALPGDFQNTFRLTAPDDVSQWLSEHQDRSFFLEESAAENAALALNIVNFTAKEGEKRAYIRRKSKGGSAAASDAAKKEGDDDQEATDEDEAPPKASEKEKEKEKAEPESAEELERRTHRRRLQYAARVAAEKSDQALVDVPLQHDKSIEEVIERCEDMIANGDEPESASSATPKRRAAKEKKSEKKEKVVEPPAPVINIPPMPFAELDAQAGEKLVAYNAEQQLQPPEMVDEALTFYVAIKICERVDLSDNLAAVMNAGDKCILAGLALMTEAQQRDLQVSSSRPVQYKMPAWWSPSMHDQAVIKGVAAYSFGRVAELKDDPVLRPVWLANGTETPEQRDEFLTEFLQDNTRFARRLTLVVDLCLFGEWRHRAQGFEDDDGELHSISRSGRPTRAAMEQREETESAAAPNKKRRRTVGEDEVETTEFTEVPQSGKKKRRGGEALEGDEAESGGRGKKRRSDTQGSDLTAGGNGLVRDAEGNVVFPIKVDRGVTILTLGHIDPHPAFHSARYIYPVGFKSMRLFTSTINPEQRVMYHMEILRSEDDDTPVFSLIGDDMPEPVLSDTASGTWTEVLRRTLIAKGEAQRDEKMRAMSGPEHFGYSDPAIVSLIERLPKAEKCTKYWKANPVASRASASTPVAATPSKTSSGKPVVVPGSGPVNASPRMRRVVVMSNEWTSNQ